MIQFTINYLDADRVFAQLEQRGINMLPLMTDLGEYLTETTKQRFPAGVAPDGTPWQPNAPATLAAYLRNGGGSGAKRPLIGETSRLSREIYHQPDQTSVEIGSGLVQSAIHQFGGQAGKGLRTTIPARPFLGLSADDQEAIIGMASDYLLS